MIRLKGSFGLWLVLNSFCLFGGPLTAQSQTPPTPLYVTNNFVAQNLIQRLGLREAAPDADLLKLEPFVTWRGLANGNTAQKQAFLQNLNQLISPAAQGATLNFTWTQWTYPHSASAHHLEDFVINGTDANDIISFVTGIFAWERALASVKAPLESIKVWGTTATPFTLQAYYLVVKGATPLPVLSSNVAATIFNPAVTGEVTKTKGRNVLDYGPFLNWSKQKFVWPGNFNVTYGDLNLGTLKEYTVAAVTKKLAGAHSLSKQAPWQFVLAWGDWRETSYSGPQQTHPKPYAPMIYEGLDQNEAQHTFAYLEAWHRSPVNFQSSLLIEAIPNTQYDPIRTEEQKAAIDLQVKNGPLGGIGDFQMLLPGHSVLGFKLQRSQH